MAHAAVLDVIDGKLQRSHSTNEGGTSKVRELMGPRQPIKLESKEADVSCDLHYISCSLLLLFTMCVYVYYIPPKLRICDCYFGIGKGVGASKGAIRIDCVEPASIALYFFCTGSEGGMPPFSTNVKSDAKPM